MKLVLPGGSGQVGTVLARALTAAGHEVVVLTRGDAAHGPGRAVRWDARTLGPWAAELDGADVVVNLAGRSVNCRYGDANRRSIMESRTDSRRSSGALLGLVEHEDISGPVNLAAPEPLPNRESMGVLRDAWGQRIGLPATSWMLAIGAFFMRTETELVLKSRRVVPGLLLERGFEFRHPAWAPTAQQLCDEVRARRSCSCPQVLRAPEPAELPDGCTSVAA